MKGKNIILIFTVLFFCFYGLSFSKEIEDNRETDKEQIRLKPIVITPLKIQQEEGQSSISVTVLNPKELKNEGITDIKEALNQVSGIDIASSGSQTGDTSVFIRGANTNHTSLVIDGIKLYDPIVTTSYYNFAHLSLDNLSKIEVAKGPQSSLYGSDSIGGLINMTTHKGKGKPTLKLSSRIGSFETFREKASFSGQKDSFHYSLSLTREDSDGFSAAAESDSNNEEDSYQRTYSSWRFDYEINNDTTVGTTGRYTHSRYEYDDSGGPGGDDPDRKGWYDEGLLSTYLKQQLTNWWNYKLNLGWTRIYRKDKDRIDETIDDWYDGRTLQVNLQNNFKLSDSNTLVLGGDYLREKAEYYYYSNHPIFGVSKTDFSKRTTNTKGVFIENIYTTKFGLNLSGSLRLQDHSKFGEHTTYKLGANYEFKDTETRLKATFGTGFNAPSLYQLYSSSGNTDFEPEESETYDIGIEQKLLDDKIKLSSTYFHTKIDDMIQYNMSTWKYEQTGSAHIEGIENAIEYKIKDNLKLKTSYTHMRAINNNKDKRLLRRADNKFSIGLDYSPLKQWDMGLDIRYTGTRQGSSTKLDEFTVVNLDTQYKVNESTEIFGRIDNLFDKDYELVEGYQTTPFSIHIGIRKTF